MSYNQSYIRIEFTIGHIDQKQEVAMCQELRKLSELVCTSLNPNNMSIEWENKTWSVQKTRFVLTYEEGHSEDVDKFLFKLKLKYPEFTEVGQQELTSRY